MELTPFHDLARLIRRLGPDELQLARCAELLRGAALAPVEELIYGREGIYWLTADSMLTRVATVVLDGGNSEQASLFGSVPEKGRPNTQVLEALPRYHLFGCDRLEAELRTTNTRECLVGRRVDGRWQLTEAEERKRRARRNDNALPLCDECTRTLQRISTAEGIDPLESHFSEDSSQRWSIGVHNPDESCPRDIHSSDWNLICDRFLTQRQQQCEGRRTRSDGTSTTCPGKPSVRFRELVQYGRVYILSSLCGECLPSLAPRAPQDQAREIPSGGASQPAK